MSDLILKKKLADFYKILSYHKIGDLTANHASILSEDKKNFYTNQHSHLFEEITPNNLIKVNLFETKKEILKKVNIAGYFIHRNIHLSKYEPQAILHTHSENAVAISCLKNGFLTKLNQSSMRFFKRIKYFDYNGMVMDKKEGLKLQKLVDRDTKLIILKNHGIIIIANTIDELFHLTFHFEKCAEIQLKIDSRSSLVKVSDKIAKLTCNQHQGFGKVGQMSWSAIKKKFKLS